MSYAEQAIKQAIEQSGGSLPFDQFMHLALYAPDYGYYVNGRPKLGPAGDFITAPEISPLFSQCLANQCAQVLNALPGGEIIEFGAGSGRMAATVLQHLEAMDCLPGRYAIMELSPDLQALQKATLQQTIPHLMARIDWIQRLPASTWRGVILANEVLDAMPVHRFRWNGDHWQELFVQHQAGSLSTEWGAIRSPGLSAALQQLGERIGRLPDGYQSEINLRLSPWLGAIAEYMAQGVLLLIDYGYTEHEYYHPERNQGTLICHHQHRVSTDPLVRIGQQDITANVDFSALAHAALDHQFDLAGYTNQAYFLLDNGLDQLFSAIQTDSTAWANALQAIKQLTLPTEMGERFKVIGLSRQMTIELNGFQSNDMRAYL